jgi:ribonuclease P protein component
MPKKYRLSHADFAHIPRSGAKRTHGTYFSLSASLITDGTTPKMASVVSKKVSARAVDRNRVERYCRESLRTHMRKIVKPVALVFLAKREAVGASLPEIQKDIDTLLVRANVLAQR